MSIVDRGSSERHIRQATVFGAQWNITTLWKVKKKLIVELVLLERQFDQKISY